MRAFELENIISERLSKPTLKSVQNRKIQLQRAEAEHVRRQPVMAAMYADRDLQLKDLEVERAQLELEQLRAEIRHTNAEAASEMADGQSAKRVADMAMNAVRKRR